MRITICGSRSITDVKYIERAIANSDFNITEVNCGMAHGVDIIAYNWARRNNLTIHKYIPDWETIGNSAGALRNIKMIDESDGAIVIWDGKSKGTKITMDYARKSKKPVFLVYDVITNELIDKEEEPIEDV
jgi:predicted Rossmann fold nucleotide-binding protein DprA/Smf involved in DNA uptake